MGSVLNENLELPKEVINNESTVELTLVPNLTDRSLDTSSNSDLIAPVASSTSRICTLAFIESSINKAATPLELDSPNIFKLPLNSY